MPSLFRIPLLCISLSIALLSPLYTYTRSLFSKQHNVEKQLISIIDTAQSKIQAAVYMITSTNVAKALIRAKKRNLSVEIITDESCILSRYGKISMLQKEDIAIFCPKQPPKSYHSAPPIMHHKFALIDNHLWTGSFTR